ncbi:hypothetical protein ACJJIU_15575 [Microbulbifer sp. CnH-101-E]|uniref:hypothetical protein n=1 Tax=unclassified Microbulbifer TaxID=2619833 RepID=UPI004038FFB6
MKLARYLGITRYAARHLKQRFIQVMLERGQRYKLSGLIELDNGYPGGEHTEFKRGAESREKIPFSAAAQRSRMGIHASIPLRKLVVCITILFTALINFLSRNLSSIG